MNYLLISDVVIQQPSLCQVKGYGLGFGLTRLFESDDDHVLQWWPGIRKIPLLTRLEHRRGHSTDKR